jgi:hypothetical protein
MRKELELIRSTLIVFNPLFATKPGGIGIDCPSSADLSG